MNVPRIYVLDGLNIIDEASFYTEISKECNFPSYFGRNLDALNDCLFDLSQGHSDTTIIWLNVHPMFKLGCPLGSHVMNLYAIVKEICQGHQIAFE